MNQVTIELGKILKTVGMCSLICMGIVSWVESNTRERNVKSRITCENESSDTIIIGQERLRGRMQMEVMTIFDVITHSMPVKAYNMVSGVHIQRLKLLFINSYQRNVFYVNVPSSVP